MARKKDALFDPACYDLANHFLEGEPVQQAVSDCQAEVNRRSLSEAIQSAVEDWFLMHPVEADLPDVILPRVGQVWRSPMLNVFDRRIMRVLDGEALYFDSDGRTWGWIGMQDWCSWVRATRATLVEDTDGPIPPEVGKILARNV